MRTVNIGELKTHLSAYLQYVRNGEEVVVRDRDVLVARISPIRATDHAVDEASLLAAGDKKPPEKEMDWDLFWSMPRADVPHDIAVQATIEGRGDR
jgi:antitoxin (DNA-binding transcriptional repressor) of toxin-antitoxin stability system